MGGVMRRARDMGMNLGGIGREEGRMIRGGISTIEHLLLRTNDGMLDPEIDGKDPSPALRLVPAPHAPQQDLLDTTSLKNKQTRIPTP